jgi:hypothetical protein
MVDAIGKSVYVIEFSNGWLKVGWSGEPVARIARHARRMLRDGHTVTRQFHARCAGNAWSSESSLIRFCAARAKVRAGFEWFEGVGFDVARSRAEELSLSEHYDWEDEDCDRANALPASHVKAAVEAIKAGHARRKAA